MEGLECKNVLVENNPRPEIVLAIPSLTGSEFIQHLISGGLT